MSIFEAVRVGDHAARRAGYQSTGSDAAGDVAEDQLVEDKNNQVLNFDPTEGLVQGTPYHGDHNNFSPRIGIAWDVAGNGKTVVRAAGGILYVQMSFDVLNGEGNLLGLRTMPTGLPRYNAGSTTPLPLAGNIQLQSLVFAPGSNALSAVSTAWKKLNPTQPISATNPALYSSVAKPACGDGITQPPWLHGPPGPCEIFGVDPNLRTPYMSKWNLDIQRAIANNITLNVGYVGNHGAKLLGKFDHNQPQTGGGFGLGWGNLAKVGSPAQMCIASALDATPYDNCSPNSGAEQAALPFTAPCAAAVGLGPNSSGGPFNPGNTCLSYLQPAAGVGRSLRGSAGSKLSF